MSNEAPASPPRRRRPTQVDLARMAGVSQATVSQVLNETPEHPARILPETRARILGAAKEIGYTFNPVARSLKGGRNHLLGLFTFEPVFPVDQRDFYFPFLLGVEEQAATHGYDLMLFTSATGSGQASIYQDGVNRLKLADGCVLLGRHVVREDIAALAHEDFPFVFIGRREVAGATIPFVGVDYARAVEHVVARLARAGRRRIALISQPGTDEVTVDRQRGYRTGLELAGISFDPELVTDTIPDAGRLAAWHTSGLDAVLVEPSETDLEISQLESAAAHAGLSIPADIAGVVLGDPTFSTATVSWAHLRIPRVEVAREAVDLLVRLLDGEATTEQILLQASLVEGDSLQPDPAEGQAAS